MQLRPSSRVHVLDYDVLRLRAAAVGNSLLVKRRHWQSMDNDFRALRLERLEEAARVAAEGGSY